MGAAVVGGASSVLSSLGASSGGVSEPAADTAGAGADAGAGPEGAAAGAGLGCRKRDEKRFYDSQKRRRKKETLLANSN